LYDIVITDKHIKQRVIHRALGLTGAKIQKFLSPEHAKNYKIGAEKHPKTSSSSLFRKEQML